MLHEILLVTVLVLLLGEYIPFTKNLWKKIGSTLKHFGEWFLEKYENRLYETKEKYKTSKEKKVQLKNFFARVLFFVMAIIVVLFLEVFWELGFKKTSQTFQKSKIASFFKKHIEEMNRYVVLALFGIPFLLMEVLGFIALGFLASGHLFTFIALYLFKVLFFIPVHFILDIGKDKLMSIAWFKRRYDIIIALLEWFKKSQTYVKVHNFTENIGAYLKGFKSLFSTQVVNLKKAFEGEALLSQECEILRVEITELEKKLGKEQVDKALYVKFLECINSHMKEIREEKIT